MTPASLERVWYPSAAGAPPSRGWGLLPLSLAAAFFRAGVALRSALFDSGVLSPTRIANAHVVSVGNLNVGGAGKTPAVIFLAHWFTQRGHRVAVLSRGYGRKDTRPVSFEGAASLPSSGEAGDEPLLIARRCPGVKLYVGADRVRSATAAVGDGADVLLLDDGFQHRRLCRDVDIVVVDESVGFGNGALLPRGPLREPLGALKRASLIWLRGSSTGSSSMSAHLPRFEVPVIRTRYVPSELLRTEDGVADSLDTLRGQNVVALCALARPSSFLGTLSSLDAQVARAFTFPDHHRFTPGELSDVLRAAEAERAVVVTTEKDAVKLPASFPARVVRLSVQIDSGEEHLERVVAPRTKSG